MMRDGAWHWSVCIYFGLEGGDLVPHGDMRRADWGWTLKSLAIAQEIARRASV